MLSGCEDSLLLRSRGYQVNLSNRCCKTEDSYFFMQCGVKPWNSMLQHIVDAKNFTS